MKRGKGAEESKWDQRGAKGVTREQRGGKITHRRQRHHKRGYASLRPVSHSQEPNGGRCSNACAPTPRYELQAQRSSPDDAAICSGDRLPRRPRKQRRYHGLISPTGASRVSLELLSLGFKKKKKSRAKNRKFRDEPLKNRKC